MKHTDRLTEYLRGERRGKAANRLERDALSDPFLYEALEGLTVAEGDIPRDIENLSVRLQKRVKSGWHFSWKGWGIAAAFLGIGILLWVAFPRKDKSLPLAAVTMSADRKTEVLKKQAPPAETSKEANRANGQEMNPAGQAAEIEKAGATDVAAPTAFSSRAVAVKALPAATGKAEISVRIENSGENGSVPIDGIEAFNRYVRDSLVYPEDALQQHLQGEIRLSFIVNKNGRPSHIRVVEWITHSCNHEAIRLLERGPAWTYTGSKEPTYLTIPFRLPPARP